MDGSYAPAAPPSAPPPQNGNGMDYDGEPRVYLYRNQLFTRVSCEMAASVRVVWLMAREEGRTTRAQADELDFLASLPIPRSSPSPSVSASMLAGTIPSLVSSSRAC